MKKRTIKILVDGRTFDGSSVEILQQMKMLAFGWDDRSLFEYLKWLRGILEQQTGQSIPLSGSNEEERSTALLDAMVANGLAVEIFEGG